MQGRQQEREKEGREEKRYDATAARGFPRIAAAVAAAALGFARRKTRRVCLSLSLSAWYFLHLSVLSSSFLPSKSSICQVEVFSHGGAEGKRETGLPQ